MQTIISSKYTCIFFCKSSGEFPEVYRARYELARYFQAAGDKWLSDHFYETCLQTSGQVTNDGGKMQAEGYCNVALAEEENGKLCEI